MSVTFKDLSYPRQINASDWTCKMNCSFSNSVTPLFGLLELSMNRIWESHYQLSFFFGKITAPHYMKARLNNVHIITFLFGGGSFQSSDKACSLCTFFCELLSNVLYNKRMLKFSDMQLAHSSPGIESHTPGSTGGHQKAQS